MGHMFWSHCILSVMGRLEQLSLAISHGAVVLDVILVPGVIWLVNLVVGVVLLVSLVSGGLF